MSTNHSAEPQRSQREAVVRAAFAALDRVPFPRPEYRRHGVLPRLAAPDLRAEFAVPWMDDGGQVRAARGYLALYGPGEPCRGALQLRAGVTADEADALAFLEKLRSCLLPEPGGSLVCAADIDPAALSDGESMRLCRSLAGAAARCLPVFPAGAALLWHMPRRERGYLAAQLEWVYHRRFPVPAAPDQAAGYGLVRFAQETLRRTGRMAYGRIAAVYGGTRLARTTAETAARQGMSVLLLDRFRPESAAADVHFFCDPARPLDRAAGELLARRPPDGVFEGAPAACRPDAARLLRREGVLIAPAIAAGAGAVLAAGWEPPRDRWLGERRLRRAMDEILRRCWETCPGDPYTGAHAAAIAAGAELLIRRGV